MSLSLSTRWLICRICLKDKNKKLYNIFEPIGEEEITDLGTILQEKIELCGAIKLNEQNNLPNRICNRCILLLRAAYKFRDLCQQSQNQLKQFITTVSQKEESEDTLEINFDSDAEEQKVEVQEESENVFRSETDYVVEERVVEEYEISEECALNTCTKNENYLATSEDVQTEIQCFSDEDSSQYVVEEVDVKQYVSEDNEDIIRYNYEEDNTDIIIEENPKKLEKQIVIKQIDRIKIKGKRTRKQSHDGVYKCSFCDNSYTDKTKYTNHLKIHVKDRPHECEICKKRFSTTPQLSRHMNSHTGNRPYKCKYCGACFGDPSTKIKHERIHTNERPYRCRLCEKAFAYSNVLKVHMMTHTGEKPHTCEICGKSFSQLHHKNAHENRHTNVHTVQVNYSPDIEYMEDEEGLREYKIEEFI